MPLLPNGVPALELALLAEDLNRNGKESPHHANVMLNVLVPRTSRAFEHSMRAEPRCSL